jgi:hypothetical protein
MAMGLKIIGGDIVINPSGQVEIIEQTDKCLRDLGKMLITDKEYVYNVTAYSRYNPNYGTELNNHALYRGLGRSSIRDTIIILLNQAIKNYVILQESRFNLDIGEIITNLKFDVFFDIEDMRNLVIEIKVSTALSNGEISLGQFTQTIA